MNVRLKLGRIKSGVVLDSNDNCSEETVHIIGSPDNGLLFRGSEEHMTPCEPNYYQIGEDVKKVKVMNGALRGHVVELLDAADVHDRSTPPSDPEATIRTTSGEVVELPISSLATFNVRLAQYLRDDHVGGYKTYRSVFVLIASEERANFDGSRIKVFIWSSHKEGNSIQ